MEKLERFRYTMDSCNHCGQCKWLLSPKAKGWDFAEICPIHQYYGFDAYSGQGLVNIAKEVMNGTLRCGEGLEELVYACSFCGACDVNCKNVRDMEVLDTALALREVCAESGALPDSLREQAKNVKDTHNIYGRPHAERFAWLPEDYEDDPGADTALFIGCAAAYAHPEIALAAIRILKAGGVKFTLLYEDEWCCGASLWRSGQHEAAAALAQRNAELFRRRGIRRIITACAECYGTLRGAYPRFCSMDAEILHISEVAAELLQSGALTLKDGCAPLRVTYHDPCMLGRLSEPYEAWEGEIRPFGLHVPEKHFRRGEHGVYAPPRAVLASLPGVELTEMVRNLEDGYCCGAASADPAVRDFAATERCREAESVGAEAVVSCCPFCLDALNGAGSLPCTDLTVLLADRLGKEAEA